MDSKGARYDKLSLMETDEAASNGSLFASGMGLASAMGYSNRNTILSTLFPITPWPKPQLVHQVDCTISKYHQPSSTVTVDLRREGTRSRKTRTHRFRLSL
ncbi:hypothetical protein MTO96_017177 [Rhipicephalus appendiculatus]